MTTSFSRFTGFHSDLDLRHFEGVENCSQKIGQHLICLPFFGQLIEGRGCWALNISDNYAGRASTLALLHATGRSLSPGA